MPYSKQIKYFETAYRTGTDIWTHKPYKSKALEFISLLPKEGFVLDLGSGRGYWAFLLAELSFKVIGIEYIKDLVDINNKEVKSRGLEKNMRFIYENALETNFDNESFDIITDFGLIQHIKKEDWGKYKNEVNRVLKSGGYILNISFGRETEKFMSFSPAKSIDGTFEKDGVFYNFLSEEDIFEIYGENMNVIKQEKVLLKDHNNEVLIFTLLKKN